MASAKASSDETSPDRQSRELSVSDFLDYKITFREDNTLQWDPPEGSLELALALSHHFLMEKGIESKMRAAIRQFLAGKLPELSRRVQGGDSHRPETPITSAALDETFSKSKEKDKAFSYEDDVGDIRGKGVKANGLKPTYADVVKSNAAQNTQRQPERPTIDERSRAAPQDGAASGKFLSWNPQVKGFQKKGTKRPYAKEEGAKVTANRGYVCGKHRKQRKKCDPEKCPDNGQRLDNPKPLKSRILSPSPMHNTHLPSPESESIPQQNGAQSSSQAPKPNHTVNPLHLNGIRNVSHEKDAEYSKRAYAQQCGKSEVATKSPGLTSREPVQDSLSANTFETTKSIDSFLYPVNGMGTGLSPSLSNTLVPPPFEYMDIFNIDPLLFSDDLTFDSELCYDSPSISQSTSEKQACEPEVPTVPKDTVSANQSYSPTYSVGYGGGSSSYYRTVMKAREIGYRDSDRGYYSSTQNSGDRRYREPGSRYYSSSPNSEDRRYRVPDTDNNYLPPLPRSSVNVRQQRHRLSDPVAMRSSDTTYEHYKAAMKSFSRLSLHDSKYSSQR